MTKKILFFVLIIIFVFSSVSFGVDIAEAQTASFPAGCATALGYSATTGLPCNGTNTATDRYMPGCESAIGYSATDGRPCSGGSIAIKWLAGCTSTIGYSSITGEPCNGTYTATPIIIPGLPSTGLGGQAFSNIMLLILSGLATVAGSIYLVKNRKGLIAR